MILVLILFFILVFLPLAYYVYVIYLQFLPGAFYYPSTPKAVKTILKLAHPQKDQTLIDLGSGDGRIIIAAAQMGLKSIGYELNPLLVFRSRRLIKKLNLTHLAQIKFKNFWKADFHQADFIVLYQFPKYVNRLYLLVQKKIKHPIILISNNYPISQVKPKKVKNKIYLYRLKLS